MKREHAAAVATSIFLCFGLLAADNSAARLWRKNASTHAFDRISAAVERADRAADSAWAALGDAQAIAAYRAKLKAAMAAAVGGFPERTPLREE